MARALVLVAALLSACGADEDEPYVLFASGDRLIAEYYAVSDVQLFIGFYDSERGERCAFTVVPTSPGFNVPGVSYCLPTAQVGSGWFADPSCTERLATVNDDAGARATIEMPGDACLEEPRAYELGEPVDAMSAYGVDANGACLPFATIGGIAPTLRRIGPPLALDAFVKAEHQLVQLSERMGALVVKADDGARLAFAGFDRMRNESTHPYGHGYELVRDRWWPRQVAYSVETNRYFADAACSKPIATKDTEDALCPITTIMEYVDESECGYGIAHFQAGREIDPASVHGLDEQGDCVPAPIGPLVRVVEIGALLPADSFAELTTVEQGAGPVVLRLYGTPDSIGVLPASDFPLFDKEREWPCQIAVGTDGTPRCLPGSLGIGAFSDPACTQRIVGFGIAGAGCEPSPPPAAVRLTADGSDSGNPDQRYAAFPVAQKIPQPANVYYTVNGTCEPHYAGPALYDWYALGPEVTIDELPRVRKVLATPP